MSRNLAILPFHYNVLTPTFTGSRNTPSNDELPQSNVKTPAKLRPVELPGVSLELATKIIEGANRTGSGVSVDDYLRLYLRHLAYKPKVLPEPSKSAVIGKTKVTTLIDGEQIFSKVIDDIKSAKKSILIEMFEFQNLRVDANKWPSNGADVVPGFEMQQSILPILISKKKENPELNIQVILDAHKWHINGYGEKERHYNNEDMIRYLKENGIDVVPYPRAAQGGAALQHVKMVAVDGKKVIIGGMNWGSHSSANHDACVAIETLPDYRHSEVDNIINEIFIKDWKFAWERIAHTKLIPGPLKEEEQELFHGLRKEIKKENVTYMRIVGELYDNDESRTRYDENDLSKLNLISVSPIQDPQIKILATKPKELYHIGEEGEETTRAYLHNKLKTCQTVRGELFVLSDKELIETIIHRVEAGELDAKFIVSSDILEQFPYCRKAYNRLIQKGIPVRLYNFDENTNQRMHAKWAVFDNEEVVIGSTNWSAMGLNQNLKKGMREDYELYTEKINAEIREYLDTVSELERKLGLPPLGDKEFYYTDLITRRKKFKKALNELNKFGATTVTLNEQVDSFEEDGIIIDEPNDDDEDFGEDFEEGIEYNFGDSDRADLYDVQGYYKIIKDRYNAQEKYKRGNNECAIAFVQPSLAKVFLRQFDKDWNISEMDYEKMRTKVLRSNVSSADGASLDIRG